VEKWLLDDRAPADFTYRPGKPLPSVLSEYFLDLYNLALAESNNLPKFSPSAIIGREFRLVLGESSLRPQGGILQAITGASRPAQVIPSKIVALTNNPDLLGLVIPLDAAETFNAWYGYKDRKYRALHVELDSAESVERLKAQLPKLGLAMSDRMGAWRQALQIVRLAGAGFIGVGALVFALALAYMASSLAAMLAQRRRELALYGALGASPRQVTGLVLAEIALTSALGIAVGLAAAVLVLVAADRFYQQWRSYRTFLPENLFAFRWWWIAALGAACWLVALALGWLRVRIALRGPIAGPLNKGE
jgi:predicted lysophospholipase L1 biosynthesis ABC-type transport system permease subunit